MSRILESALLHHEKNELEQQFSETCRLAVTGDLLAKARLPELERRLVAAKRACEQHGQPSEGLF